MTVPRAVGDRDVHKQHTRSTGLLHFVEIFDLMLNWPKRTLRYLKRLYRLPSETKAIRQNLAQLTAEVEVHIRETRVVLNHIALPERSLWDGKPTMTPGTPGQSIFPNGALCRQADFDTSYFHFWTARLGEGLRYHRKLWEFVFICQSLWERGAVTPGRRGLGFGVGIEPLSAFFASHDCEVLATDLNTGEAVDMGWAATNQHAAGKEALRKPWVCPDSLFDRNVEFRECDMNNIPDSFTDFDFCWSACALEHLGSIELGLAFIERSIQCLKPGGWAVHTTEFNLSSDDATVDDEFTVLFRRRDLEALAARLTAQGHQVAAFNFDPGNDPVDRYIDVAPYREQPHLKVALAGFAATSVGIIVQRGR